MSTTTDRYVRVATLTEVQTTGSLVVAIEGYTLGLFSQGDKIYAVDNRCPHMGFPLHRGTVKDCILTCDWHHARFDLASGGTFDAWADDVRSFPVLIRQAEVWVDLTPQTEPQAHLHQGLRRVASSNLLRGVFDAAMSIYLDRYLNIPPARLPDPADTVENPDLLLKELPDLLDRQQQVNAAGKLVARYLYSGGKPERLLAMLGKLLLREDRDFHTIQEVEAAFRQYSLLRETPAGVPVLIAVARYLAAHAPTMRSQGQIYEMATRLHRGDRVFEDT